MSAEDLYLDPGARLPYCRGCGHSQVVRSLSGALQRLAMPPRSVVLTTDIGCLGLADSLFPHLHTVHTTHGRSTAFATGMSLAEAVGEPSGVKPVVMIGDGGAMIGLLHLVHAAQLNVDVTVLLHNNFVFGMTGGQHSAMTPEGMVTTTTPDGNYVPPLDMTAVLAAAHAGFLARHYATDKDLGAAIAEAIDYPGFALVEVVELCTAYATRKNPITGKTLHDWVEGRGLRTGRLADDKQRTDFASRYRERLAAAAGSATAAARGANGGAAPVSRASLATELRLVVAGSAGEGVQSSARLFCQAALAANLYATQKNDNPVTVGSGFSLSEVCLSNEPIDYTGIETPDVVIIASADGWNHLQAAGLFERCAADTTIIVDDSLDDPPTAGDRRRLPLRQNAGPRLAALTGLVAWAVGAGLVLDAAWESAMVGLPEPRRQQIKKALATGRDLAGSIRPPRSSSD